MTIGTRRFIGKYQDVVGTDMIFDPGHMKNAGYMTACTRRLVFREDGG